MSKPEAFVPRTVAFGNTTQNITVGLGKAGQTEVGFSRLSAEVVEFVFHYGLKQLLNDAHASEKEPEAKLALVTKKLEALYEGKVGRKPGEARMPSDPLGRETVRLVRAQLRAWGDAKVEAALKQHQLSLEELIAKLIVKLRPQAEANLAAIGALEIEI